MKYITIVAKDFETAVKKAHLEYGHSIRIHSRRDISRRGGFLWLKNSPYVEIVCYVASTKNSSSLSILDEKQKETPHTQENFDKKEILNEEIEQTNLISREIKEDSQPSLKDTLLSHATQLLEENQFSKNCINILISLLSEELKEITENLSITELELLLVDKIVSLIAIDHETQLHPPHFLIVLGPTGTGKTTTIAKIGALYSLQHEDEYRHSVHFITLDDYRVGASEQLKAFGDSLHINVDLIRDEQEMYRIIQQTQEIDVVIVDTVGRSPKDKELTLKMNTMLSLIPSEQKRIYIALSGSMKSEDILTSIEMYSSYPLQSIIITKVDETKSIGSILSIAYEKNLPLLFFTDGQHVPSDIHKASTATMLSFLHGFSLDFESMWANQSNLFFHQQ